MKIIGQKNCINVSIALLCMLLLFSCNEDKNLGDPPAVGITHTIGGTVSNMYGSVCKDISVILESDGVSMQTKTDTLGVYTFAGLQKTGIYKLKFEGKDNMLGQEAVVELKAMGNNVQCEYFDIQLPTITTPMPIVYNKDTLIEFKTMGNNSYKVGAVFNVALSIPANTVAEGTQLTLTQLPFVNVPVNANNGIFPADKVPPLVIIKMEPTDLELKNPVKLTVTNSVYEKNAKAYLKWMTLYKLENNEWVRKSEVPLNASMNYETNISALGVYMLAPVWNVTTSEYTKKVPTVNDGIFHNKGDEPMNITKVRYKRFDGWEFKELVSNSVKSAGSKSKNLPLLLSQMIMNTMGRSERYVTCHDMFITNLSLPAGTKFVMAGNQTYTTTVYSATVSENNVDKVVNMEVTRYKGCNFMMSTSN